MVETCATHQSSANEHDGDRKMFKILGTPCRPPSCQVLEEHVGRTVEEDQEALHELCRRTVLPCASWFDIPSLAKLAQVGTWETLYLPSQSRQSSLPSAQELICRTRRTHHPL